jgi:hypothetical protein
VNASVNVTSLPSSTSGGSSTLSNLVVLGGLVAVAAVVVGLVVYRMRSRKPPAAGEDPVGPTSEG